MAEEVTEVTTVQPGEQPAPAPTEPVTPQVTASPQPAPQPAPDTAPAPQPEAAPAPVPAPQPEYTATGNKVLDAAAKVLLDKGLDPTALAQEIEQGGLSPQSKAAMDAALGADQSAILEATYVSETAKVKQSVQQKLDTVHSAVGGQEEWDAIVAWTQTPEAGLDEQAANDYNELLNAGGVKAQLAARALKEAYMSSPGFKEQNPTAVQPQGMVAPTPTVAPIARRQYVEERKKAVREGNAALVESLDARARYTMERVPSSWRLAPIDN